MVLDVGTSNRVLKEDPLYLGLNQDRMSGPEYFEVCSSLMKGSQCRSLYNSSRLATKDVLVALTADHHTLGPSHCTHCERQ